MKLIDLTQPRIDFNTFMGSEEMKGVTVTFGEVTVCGGGYAVLDREFYRIESDEDGDVTSSFCGMVWSPTAAKGLAALKHVMSGATYYRKSEDKLIPARFLFWRFNRIERGPARQFPMFA